VEKQKTMSTTKTYTTYGEACKAYGEVDCKLYPKGCNACAQNPWNYKTQRDILIKMQHQAENDAIELYRNMQQAISTKAMRKIVESTLHPWITTLAERTLGETKDWKNTSKLFISECSSVVLIICEIINNMKEWQFKQFKNREYDIPTGQKVGKRGFDGN